MHSTLAPCHAQSHLFRSWRRKENCFFFFCRWFLKKKKPSRVFALNFPGFFFFSSLFASSYDPTRIHITRPPSSLYASNPSPPLGPVGLFQSRSPGRFNVDESRRPQHGSLQAAAPAACPCCGGTRALFVPWSPATRSRCSRVLVASPGPPSDPILPCGVRASPRASSMCAAQPHPRVFTWGICSW